MIVLDENFPDDQRKFLKQYGFSVRQIGIEIGEAGMQDDRIISLLARRRGATFLTHDADFSDPRLAHRKYGIVHLAVPQESLAEYGRRVLRHPN